MTPLEQQLAATAYSPFTSTELPQSASAWWRSALGKSFVETFPSRQLSPMQPQDAVPQPLCSAVLGGAKAADFPRIPPIVLDQNLQAHFARCSRYANGTADPASILAEARSIADTLTTSAQTRTKAPPSSTSVLSSLRPEDENLKTGREGAFGIYLAAQESLSGSCAGAGVIADRLVHAGTRNFEYQRSLAILLVLVQAILNQKQEHGLSRILLTEVQNCISDMLECTWRHMDVEAIRTVNGIGALPSDAEQLRSQALRIVKFTGELAGSHLLHKSALHSLVLTVLGIENAPQHTDGAALVKLTRYTEFVPGNAPAFTPQIDLRFLPPSAQYVAARPVTATHLCAAYYMLLHGRRCLSVSSLSELRSMFVELGVAVALRGGESCNMIRRWLIELCNVIDQVDRDELKYHGGVYDRRLDTPHGSLLDLLCPIVSR